MCIQNAWINFDYNFKVDSKPTTNSKITCFPAAHSAMYGDAVPVVLSSFIWFKYAMSGQTFAQDLCTTFVWLASTMSRTSCLQLVSIARSLFFPLSSLSLPLCAYFTLNLCAAFAHFSLANCWRHFLIYLRINKIQNHAYAAWCGSQMTLMTVRCPMICFCAAQER